MEEFLAGKGEYKMPPAEGQDTIFEYLVNEQGEWEHWSERVGVVRCLCFTKDWLSKQKTRMCHYSLPLFSS